MWKVQSTSTWSLDGDLSWSFQEILIEAVVVLWLATNVSVELSRQFFREWRESRIDPELVMAPDTGPLSEKSLSRLFLGANSTGCFWNRVASFWKQYDDGLCLDHSLPLHDLDGSKTKFGYYGTFVMLLTTAILYTAFFCSLFVNRHWRLPSWRMPRVDKFFMQNDGKREENKDHRESETIWSNLLAVLAVILMFAALAAVAVAAIGGWLILWVWPVVILVTVTTHAIVAVYGDEAVFPCCVIVTCIMTVYCTGRIWGVWMKDSYWNTILGLIRKTRGEETVEKEARPSAVVKDLWGNDFSWIFKFVFGSEAIWMIVWPFIGRQFPSVFTYLPFEGLTVANDCLRISNSTENLDRTDALLSYWVDASDLFDNATGISLPAVSPLSQAIGRAYLAWNVVLIVGSSWPLYMLCFVGFGLMIYTIYVAGMSCFHKCQTKDATQRLAQKRIPHGEVSRPDEGPLDAPRSIIAGISNAVTLYNLAYLAPEFFLPERYQLPGILFLTTCFMGWLYRLAVPGFIAEWRSRKQMRSSRGERQRLLDAKRKPRRMTL